MAEQSLPLCGVCRRAPRVGEQTQPIRLQPGEVTAKDGTPAEPGLYAACPECVDSHRLYVAQQLGKKPTQITREMMQ